MEQKIERNLISQCTKEVLARKKAGGVMLGRPKVNAANEQRR
jgi:DNA invertase Pin-like site-specific DNA recombinase